MVFRSDLSWRGYITLISRKVNYSPFKLKHHRNSLSEILKVKLNSALIFPLLDNRCLVYHDLTDDLNSSLQILINNRICFIFNISRDTHITPYRQRLKLLSVKSRRLSLLSCSTNRILHLPYAPYLQDEFLHHQSSVLRPSREVAPACVFFIPPHRTTTYSKSFLISSF